MVPKPFTSLAVALGIALLSPPVAAQEANLAENSIRVETRQAITRETLKGFVDERYFERIDSMSNDTLSLMIPIIQSAEQTIENERYRGSFIKGIVAVFLAPDVADLDQSIERFSRAGLQVDETDILLARAYLGLEEDRIAAENAAVLSDIAAQDEIIARQREQIEELSQRIVELQAQSAESQAQIERLERMREDILGIISDIEQLNRQ